MRRLRSYSVEIVLISILGAAVAYFGYLGYGLLALGDEVEPFSGEHARYYVAQQMNFGPRVAGSDSGKRAGDWIINELSQLGWDVIVEPFVAGGSSDVRNIIAFSGDITGVDPVVIVSTHYDSRAASDMDSDQEKHHLPTPGANAGASGVGVLLELARTLDIEAMGGKVCLVFFDAEDNGGLPAWEYAMGSEAFLQRLESDTPACRSPRVAVYLDMVGAHNARIAAIAPSMPSLPRALAQTAEGIGYTEAFRGAQLRDEVDTLDRFADAGVPAVMLAESDYRYRHTSGDTLDKISADTLQKLGDILKAWLESGAPLEPE